MTYGHKRYLSVYNTITRNTLESRNTKQLRLELLRQRTPHTSVGVRHCVHLTAFGLKDTGQVGLNSHLTLIYNFNKHTGF